MATDPDTLTTPNYPCVVGELGRRSKTVGMSGWRLSRLLGALAAGSLGAFSAAAELSGQDDPSLLTVVLWSSVAVVACALGAGELIRARAEDAQARRRSADEAQRAGVQRLAELRAHFEPRARGVLPFGTLSGWYFYGRVRALSEIVGWLSDLSGGDTRARLVTGGPGAGKSAVLGRVGGHVTPAASVSRSAGGDRACSRGDRVPFGRYQQLCTRPWTHCERGRGRGGA